MDVAYAERNRVDIAKKTRINFIYLAVKILWRKLIGYDHHQVKSIIVYPTINTLENLTDVSNRLAWGLPAKKDLKVYIVVSNELLNTSLTSLIPSKAQKNFIVNNSDFQLIEEVSISQIKFDALFIQKIQWNFFILKNLFKTEIIDKNYFAATESVVWQYFYYNTFSAAENKSFEKLSQQNFSSFIKLQDGKTKAYCFVSGPSFDKYPDYTYESDSIKVICNSIVKNQTFLNYIGKPDLLVFADPVFHYSPCLYSATFRQQMIEVVEKYDCYIATTIQSVPLLLHYFPSLKNKIIGVNKGKRMPMNFPSTEKLFVRSVNNILTMFMLPFASSIANEIAVIGADGRKPDEKYFWKHSSSVQLDDLMQTAFETHPSFFRDRDYADYYEEHCLYLEKLISFGEQQGKKYYSLTASYIPAFQKRLLSNGTKTETSA